MKRAVETLADIRPAPSWPPADWPPPVGAKLRRASPDGVRGVVAHVRAHVDEGEVVVIRWWQAGRRWRYELLDVYAWHARIWRTA